MVGYHTSSPAFPLGPCKAVIQPGRMSPVLIHACLRRLLCCGILGDLVLFCFMSMCFPSTQAYSSRHSFPHQAQLPFTLSHQAEQLDWYPRLAFQAPCSNLGSPGCCSSKMPTGNCLRPWVFPLSETLVQFKFSKTPSFLQKIRQRMISIDSYHSPLQMTTLLKWLILSKVHSVFFPSTHSYPQWPVRLNHVI